MKFPLFKNYFVPTILTLTALFCSCILIQGCHSNNKKSENTHANYEDFHLNGVDFRMIFVEGGDFVMNEGNEQVNDTNQQMHIAHSVALSDFYIGETEVTQALWQAVMGTNPSHFKGNLQRPVECVSWNDCQLFIQKLNQLTGRTFALPTEAQWEYAALGGTKSQHHRYAGSDNIDEVAWYRNNAREGLDTLDANYGTHPVKSKKPNELGLYDMSGNIWEWCHDWFDAYPTTPQQDPTGSKNGERRICRGGGWKGIESYARCTERDHLPQDYGDYGLGFRLILTNSNQRP